MNEGQAREDLQTGIEAKNLKENPVFKIIFENIEKELLDIIRNSNPSEVKEREEAYFQINALKSVQSKIQSIIDDGKVADRYLQELRK
jgi:predicted phosphoribosyltransferase